MNKYQATLFSNESDIYTALHSNKSKLSEGSLRKMAFNRGLLFPKSLEREDLIEKLADLPFSYSHVVEIQKKLTSHSSQEVYSVKRFYDDFDIDELYDIVETVKSERPRMLGSEKIEHFGAAGQYVVSVEYTEFDFKRSKFQQSKCYGGDIRFIVHRDYVSVRYTYTKRIKEILSRIIDAYNAKKSTKVTINEIDLSSITNAELRNMFAKHLYDFEGVYNDTSGFVYAGLEKVRVSRIKTILEEQEVDGMMELDSDDLEPEENDIDSDIQQDDNENRMFIDNAAYDGQSLVNTSQIEELCGENFYRSHIKWKSKATFLRGNPVITFELAFDDKHLAKEIKFKILTKEVAGVPESREKLSDAEFDLVMSRLEEKIFLINDFIIEKAESQFAAQQEFTSEAQKEAV